MPTDPFLIRPFRQTDSRAVAAMLCKLAAFHGDTTPCKAKDFETYACGPKKCSFLWVALIKKKPVGFIECTIGMDFLHGELFARVNYLFVEEKVRQMGLGQALIRTVIAYALSQGCTRFDIGADPKNKLSNKVYTKLGLIRKRKAHTDFRADKAMMKKILQKSI